MAPFVLGRLLVVIIPLFDNLGPLLTTLQVGPAALHSLVCASAGLGHWQA